MIEYPRGTRVRFESFSFTDDNCYVRGYDGNYAARPVVEIMCSRSWRYTSAIDPHPEWVHISLITPLCKHCQQVLNKHAGKHCLFSTTEYELDIHPERAE